ncbi:uncharacterized protein SCHCODRAFT_02673518 [Schizophyllum commune H4-8]|nr:uncharacterized protein SCHCODRAFT_02673518 [Schizophyllum commune H4-8]KAI5885300.1 hypothetical protein SCHCODRAFT_02673518 [Schizophyllum commune H4-8]
MTGVYILGRGSEGWYFPPCPHPRPPAVRSSRRPGRRRRRTRHPPTTAQKAGRALLQSESALRSAPTCSFRTPIKLSEPAVIPLALQGPKHAKSTSIAPRSAPVALADRRDDTRRQTEEGWGRREAARSAAALQAPSVAGNIAN